MPVLRHPERFMPSPERVLARYRPFEAERAQTLVARVLALPQASLQQTLEQVFRDFGERHRALKQILLRHYQQAAHHLSPEQQRQIRPEQQMLLGAYFTMEYAIEAAAFFNPSLVLAADQTGLEEGQQRVYFSFRAVGEGHISSLVFREGLLNADFKLQAQDASRWVEGPSLIRFPSHHKPELRQQALAQGLTEELIDPLLQSLPEPYTYNQLRQAIEDRQRENMPSAQDQALRQLLESSEDFYELCFDSSTELSERVIFPVLEHECNGIEDARFVRFSGPDGQHTYYGTYTAYDGRQIQPRLLQTDDFVSFRSFGLSGPGAQNKNLALFPRQIKGRYAMLSRLDGVNNYLAFSDRLTHWENPLLIQQPQEPWELGNIGNCGSPLETEAGWLVITHGVGPMRQYTLGAILLDLEDPGKIIGRLHQPLLVPQADEREGYVPNVVYSCGSLIHQGRLLIAYGMSDRCGGLISIELAELLDMLS